MVKIGTRKQGNFVTRKIEINAHYAHVHVHKINETSLLGHIFFSVNRLVEINTYIKTKSDHLVHQHIKSVSLK